MRIAITGGTGFVGRHLARSLVEQGHEVVLIARGKDRRDLEVTNLPRVSLAQASVGDAKALHQAFAGCSAVAHCAGINREIGEQTYQAVHVQGTRAVIEAARQAGVEKIVLLSFLRARPDCRLPYHESKWHAEEIVRGSGLDYTILKAGIIYGRGDHLLDHLSRALYTFPIFGLVGTKEAPVAPVAVEDVVAIFCAALLERKLPRQTVAVVGPERLTLREVVARVGDTIGRRPRFVRLPVLVQILLAWFWERLMRIPLVAIAQVHILAEGAAEAVEDAVPLPEGLSPRRAFVPAQIGKGLPPLRRLSLDDLRCGTRCSASGG